MKVGAGRCLKQAAGGRTLIPGRAVPRVELGVGGCVGGGDRTCGPKVVQQVCGSVWPVGHCRAVVGQVDLAQCHLLAGSDIIGGYGGWCVVSKFGTKVVPRWSKRSKNQSCGKLSETWRYVVGFGLRRPEVGEN